MTDTTLLFTGIVVFGLMAVGVWMTILEFGRSGSVEASDSNRDNPSD